MPISYDIDEERGFVRTVATGRLTDAELLEHKHALMADPRFRDGMKELSDIRGVDDLQVTPQGVMRAASFDSANNAAMGTHRLGLLVPSDYVFGMARMYQMRTDQNMGVEVFRDDEEAQRWLDEVGPSD